jgi:hypothetical protein
VRRGILKGLHGLEDGVPTAVEDTQLASSPATLRVVLHRRVKLRDRRRRGHGSDVDEHRVLGIELRGEPREKPEVRVKLAAVTGFEGEGELHGEVVLSLDLVSGELDRPLKEVHGHWAAEVMVPQERRIKHMELTGAVVQEGWGSTIQAVNNDADSDF